MTLEVPKVFFEKSGVVGQSTFGIQSTFVRLTFVTKPLLVLVLVFSSRLSQVPKGGTT